MTSRSHLNTFLFVLSLFVIQQSFIVSTYQGYNKCFSADVSSDKTLEVRFGFPRREKYNCKIGLDINLINSKNSEGQKENKIFYSGQFSCFSMNPRQPYVFKHTPSQQQYGASYKICIRNKADDGNNQTFVELVISQKYDPTLYQEAFENIPLVQSSQVFEIQQMIMSVKRSLTYCDQNIQKAEDLGQKLQMQIKHADSLTNKLTYLQIIVLLVYGVIWMLFVWFLYKKWKK